MKKRILLKTLALACAACVSVSAETSPAGIDSPAAEGPKLVEAETLGIGRLVPDLEFSPVAGQKFRLGDLRSAPAVVIAFTSVSCPVTKRYAPTLAALEREFSARGVKFLFVNPIASDGPNEIAEAIKAQGFKGPYVRDPDGGAGAKLGARSTAEVFVLDGSRTLLYRGAVDDQYGTGYSIAAPRRRFLADALEAILAGRTPPTPATTAPGCALETAAKDLAQAAPLTYHSRVSRIVQNHCQECHRAGGVAPFALETYAEVASHAGMVRKQVEKGAMPPWFAVPTHPGPSPWANDRTLSARDKQDLLAWIESGKAEGDPADAPKPRQFPKDWQIGIPDLVVSIPEPIEVKATGTMPYQNIFVETKFTEPRWVRAIEMRPTAREVVHHALVYVVPPERLEKARKKGGDTGEGNFFAVYVPGNNVLDFPEGFAKLIPAGATLHFQIHYTPNGTATRDQTALGLVFAKTPPRHEVRVAAVSAKLDIPPGDPNYEARGKVPVPFDAKLLSFMPHMHLRGKAYRYELELPNHERTEVLNVPRYDFNWQLQYRLREPLDAPAGSFLRGTAHYDNSTNNPANPDPTQRVKWGKQTDEEMMLGYFEYYVPSVAPGDKQPSLVELSMRDGGLAFNNLDKNHDGKLTPDESPTPEQFRDADTNADGIVTRDEFKAYWQRKNKKERTGAGE